MGPYSAKSALSFWLVFQSSFRKAIRPQKVRKRLTSLPMAAAPVARMVAAMSLSTVPENRTMESFSLIGVPRFLSSPI
ncbi:hypothetical protein D3C86_2203450 [compost metagenome]